MVHVCHLYQHHLFLEEAERTLLFIMGIKRIKSPFEISHPQKITCLTIRKREQGRVGKERERPLDVHDTRTLIRLFFLERKNRTKCTVRRTCTVRSPESVGWLNGKSLCWQIHSAVDVEFNCCVEENLKEYTNSVCLTVKCVSKTTTRCYHCNRVYWIISQSVDIILNTISN